MNMRDYNEKMLTIPSKRDDLQLAAEQSVDGPGFLITSVEQLSGLAQARSLWPVTMGLACCAIEIMPEPKWVISMGACASSGGVFNNYAIVQGCDHIVPVDIYLPGCPPRPEMLINAMLELTRQIERRPIFSHREEIARAVEAAALAAAPVSEMKGQLA